MNPLMMMWKSRLRLLISWKEGKKTRAGKLERKGKGAEGKAVETPRAGEKHRGSDPDDSATLTEMMRKKALEDKKWKLDEQAAAMRASKKARLQKETPPAPSESEIDMVFLVETVAIFWRRYMLLLLLQVVFEYYGCLMAGVQSSKAPRKINISKITPPSSPPSRTIELSPPCDDLGEKKKQDDVNAEHVGEGGGDGAGGAGGHVVGGPGGDGQDKGIDTEAESSEAT
ncbi:hypothetical protein Hanom_Chr13g01208901 [Helianthus anomalus]